MTPAQFNDYVRKELEQNAALVKAAGIKAAIIANDFRIFAQRKYP